MVVEGGEGRTGFGTRTQFSKEQNLVEIVVMTFLDFSLMMKCWSTKSVLLSLKMQLFGKFEIMFNAEYSVWTVEGRFTNTE